MNPASIILHLVVQAPYLVGERGIIPIKVIPSKGLEIDLESFRECFDYCEEYIK